MSIYNPGVDDAPFMLPPRSVRVGFIDYRIDYMHWQESSPQEIYGDCDIPGARIRVCADRGQQRLANTALHEVLHAAYDAAHLPERPKEEDVVRGLADVLCAVIRDNPEFVTFLSKSFEPRSN